MSGWFRPTCNWSLVSLLDVFTHESNVICCKIIWVFGYLGIVVLSCIHIHKISQHVQVVQVTWCHGGTSIAPRLLLEELDDIWRLGWHRRRLGWRSWPIHTALSRALSRALCCTANSEQFNINSTSIQHQFNINSTKSPA